MSVIPGTAESSLHRSHGHRIMYREYIGKGDGVVCKSRKYDFVEIHEADSGVSRGRPWD